MKVRDIKYLGLYLSCFLMFVSLMGKADVIISGAEASRSRQIRLRSPSCDLMGPEWLGNGI